jgi:hypothetical protein
MTNLINIEGTLFDSITLRSADWSMIDNTFAACYCTDVDGNLCHVKTWNDDGEKYMIISKREKQIEITIKSLDADVPYGTGVDKKLSALLGDETLRLDTNNNGLRQNPYAHKDEAPIWKLDVKVQKLYYNIEGFTPEEYSRLTGEPVPNQWWSALIAEENGKVHAFEENGNMSIIGGASAFSKKGRLITKIWGKSNIIVNVI